MMMRKLIMFILIATVFFPCAVLAQSEDLEELMQSDDYIFSSLVVVSPGDKLYSSSGHVALRMSCPKQDVDYIYEFDAAPSSEESLIVEYLNGSLQGSFIRLYAEDFFNKVRAENRKYVDYPLNLTPEQEVRLWATLDDEVDSEKSYPLVPESNNCCTMIVRVLDKSLKTNILSKREWAVDPSTPSRKYFEDIFRYSPWIGLLWDLLVGTNYENSLNSINLIYPRIIGTQMSLVQNPQNGQCLMQTSSVEDEMFTYSGNIFSPFNVFLAVFIISLILTILNFQNKMLGVSRIFDVLLLVIITMIGIILWYRVVISLFKDEIYFNALIAVFNPFPLFLLFTRKNKIRKLYALIFLAISIIYLLLIFYIPQIQVYGLWLFIATILVRSLCNYKKISGVSF